MNVRHMTSMAGVAAALAVALLGFGSSVEGQSRMLPTAVDPNYEQPRTAWGEPDLSGLWETRAQTPMQRSPELAEREFLTEEEAILRLGRGIDSSGDDDFVTEELETADVERFSRADAPDDGRPGRRIAGAEYNAFWNSQVNDRLVSLRTSQIVDPPDGRVPVYTREALERYEARHKARMGRSESDGPEDREISARCLIRFGLPLGEMNGGGDGSTKEIFQTPGYVVFVLQYQVNRIVPLDGRPHVGSGIRSWYGDSRGHWEGNTLVIETTNFNDRQDGGPVLAAHGGLFPHPHAHNYPGTGENLRMVERITHLDADNVEYRYTVEDPDVFVRPFTAVNVWTRDQERQDRMFEYSCHEHNYGMVNLLEGGRVNPESAMDEARRDAAVRTPHLEEEWERRNQWEASQAADR